MSNIKHVEDVVTNFLQDDSTSVLVLKGGWGVGKTYFWKRYINKKIEEKVIKQIAYSYISLFGLNDLKDTRSRIFQKGTPLKSEAEMQTALEESEKEQGKMLNLVPSLKRVAKEKARGLGFLTTWGKELPYVKEVASVITAMEHGLIRDYLICFDDLERKGDNLQIKEIMGLVDELVTEKRCKVILIFNEATLNDKNYDKQQFNTYREKIVDVEIEYKPSVDENISLVFAETDTGHTTISKIFNFLEVSNIRIYKKTKWALERIQPSIHLVTQALQEEIMKHLLVFSWAYYNADNNLSLTMVAKRMRSNSWLSSLIKTDKEPSEADKQWNIIAANLDLSDAVYDPHLITLLTEGILNKDDFEKVLVDLSKKDHELIVATKLKKAWEIYSDSFKDNLTEFINAIITILDEDVVNIKFYDLASAIDVLDEYGVDVDKYIDKYIKAQSEKLKSEDLDSHPRYHEIRCKKLKNSIQKMREAEIEKKLTIDNVAFKIYSTGGWNPQDIVFLDSLKVEDLISWMMTAPENLVEKVRGGLLFFRKLQGASDEDNIKYKNIAQMTEKALREVAKMNDFNKKRVTLIYGISLDEGEIKSTGDAND